MPSTPMPSATVPSTTVPSTTKEQGSASEQALVDGFEGLTLAAGTLDHREHVRLTWIYLRRLPVLEVLSRLRQGLERFAAHHGVEGLYHETITWAFVLVINDRMCGGPELEPWGAFEERNPDLFAYRPSILDRYYKAETLASPLAKRVFVWPDRFPTDPLHESASP